MDNTGQADEVTGFLDPDTDQTMVWCSHCLDWHAHGAMVLGDRQHRIAHCAIPGSPYRPNGYYVRVMREWTEEVRSSMTPASPTQQQALWEGRMTPAIERLRAQELPS